MKRKQRNPMPPRCERTRRHSSDYVVVFIDHDVVYKNCVTIYIIVVR